jgi:uncharacterized protein YyaL (SSP411 family)
VNRLQDAASAYLRSAAHQPVHWHPWGGEAFARARAEHRPILLDIGAVWCHWCHVMDGESYEDPDLARYLNEHFVCVKVDRDERPDVDVRYQRAVQALAGQGGWPLTAFLTPDGDVFYGGTYFPPDGRFGRPGFRTVLERVREVFHAEPDKVRQTAAELRGHVAAALVESAPGTLGPDLLVQGAERMARLFDWRYGGFGTAPKFPHPGAIEFLVGRWWDTREPWLREIAEKTLAGMVRGGVYDQVGGGFHRYSVDERWVVPHFEKMSYDNAELLRACLHAYAAFGTPLLREASEGIVAWAQEVLADPDGGFGASQDADVGLNDDGDYFTWTPDEASAVLAADEWDVARRRWDIYPEGDMHHDPAKNVLWVARSIEAIAQETEREPGAVRDLLERARAKLKAAREARAAPFVDRSLYVSWNAMLAEAFLEAGAILHRPDCTDAALRTLERIWTEGWDAERGLPHRLAPRSSPLLPRLLDDQVHAASALVAACEHTGDVRWLERAEQVVRRMVADFWDGTDGGFFDTAGEAEGLLASRAKPIQDAPTASANGTAALVLLRLAVITGNAGHRERAERLLAAFAGTAGELGIHGATFLRAVDFLLQTESRVVVAEGPGPQARLLPAALRTWRPRRVIIHQPEGTLSGSGPAAMVCAGAVCALPSRTAEELAHTLATFGRPG